MHQLDSGFQLQIIASHIIKVHASAGAALGDNRVVSKEENWLKRYIVLRTQSYILCTMMQLKY